MTYVDVVRHNHSVGNNMHHFEWCTKYRYKMFRKEKYKTLCERVLREVAKRHGIEIREMSVLPDHVHIIADVPLTMAPVKAEQLLKGASAHTIFKAVPPACDIQEVVCGALESSTILSGMQTFIQLKTM